jgi:hypothetical protein
MRQNSFTHGPWRGFWLVLVAAPALWLVLALAAGAAPGARPGAQTDDPAVAGWDLSWYLIGGSGGTASGGNFSLSGSAGQAAAGRLTGGGFTLAGGFWVPVGSSTLPARGYLPLLMRNQ